MADWDDGLPANYLQEKPKPISWVAIKNAWNNVAVQCNLDEILDLSGGRQTTVRARINKYGVDALMTVISMPLESAFLRGEKPGYEFRASFDWLMKDLNFLRTLEGKYRDREEPEIPSWR